MKKLLFFFFNASLMLLTGCSTSVENSIVCVQLDPLEKVFTEETYFVENAETAAVAKGETVTFQFVIKCAYPIQELKIEAGNLDNGNRQITASLKAFVGYIRAGVHAGVFGAKSKDAVFPVSDYYPDCLQEVESIDVQPLQNQPMWIEYNIPYDATDGNYTAHITFTGKINGKTFEITKEVSAKVYPVTMPEQTLWVTNWFTMTEISQMNGNQPVEQFSDRYWELLTAMAHVMREHRQNMYLTSINFSWAELFDIKCTGTQFTFDFTNFDKMVEILIREGGLKRIEGGHIGGFNCNGIYVPTIGVRPFDNDTAQIFLSQFLPALYGHLETKGWKDMYVQHIADEPWVQNIPTYIRIAGFVKKYMPGIPIVDAVDAHVTHEIINSVNIWVPILDQYHKNYAFFRERQVVDEVWFYTCCNPQNNYANRFLEQPLVQTRFLHWINYRYGATGYLHWGFNWWESETNDAHIKHTWPAGDAWIIYPAEGKVYSSIRLAAMRDGIADYELLKLLEKKDPDKAKEVVGDVIKDFNSYNSNVRAFRLTRLKLLQWLSE